MRSHASAICCGVLRDAPPFLFDWVFEHTLFCAIDPAERDEYVRAVLRWLKPNGQYLAVNYLIPDEAGPPFGTTREEALAWCLAWVQTQETRRA